MALNVIFAGDGKTESAARYIPVPELLIELGFIEWARDLPGGPMAPLFPEVAHGTSIDRLCDIFSKRCASLFKRLGLKDWHEDLYALRKTLSTSLSVAGIEESKRQVIAGHCGGSILNIHYTSHNAGHLKKVIDLVDFQVQVRWSERHGFPLIVGCNLLIESLADVDVTLADDGSLDVVTVTGEGADIPNQTFHMASENAQQPDQNSFSHSPEAQAAFWLMHALNGRQPRRLRDPRKQQLVEHLLGLAAPVSSVAEVEA